MKTVAANWFNVDKMFDLLTNNEMMRVKGGDDPIGDEKAGKIPQL